MASKYSGTFSLLLFMAINCQAQNNPPVNDPTWRKIRTTCSDVSEVKEAAIPIGENGKYVWEFQQNFLDAAEVNLDIDNEEEIANKIKTVWDAYEEQLICITTGFSGNPMKYAVNYHFGEFLYSMIEWNIDLNHIDGPKQTTLLDHVQEKIDSFVGFASERTYREYYKILRNAGAKHASELNTLRP